MTAQRTVSTSTRIILALAASLLLLIALSAYSVTSVQGTALAITVGLGVWLFNGVRALRRVTRAV